MKISVIVPVFNCEAYLPACIDSILAQSYSNLEIILIDDGSTDASGALCDGFAMKDARIHVIHQTNQGVSAARNAGLHIANGDLISFIDADDTLDSDMYEFLVNLLAQYDADIAHCAYRHIVGEEIRLVHDTKKVYPQDRQEALRCLVGSTLFVGSLWNKLYRREILQGITFDESLKINEDILFNYWAFKSTKKTVFADNAKYNYIAHFTSSACFVTANTKKALDACRVNEIIYNDVKGTKLQNTAGTRYLRSLSGYFRTCYQSQPHRKECRRISDSIWRVYKENPLIGRNMKVTALLTHYMPWLYNLIYSIHDIIRKPNWEV